MTLSSITAGLDGSDDLALIDITREGVPASILEELGEALSVDRRFVAKVLHISERTLSRRMQQNRNLTADETDRALRLARVVAKATDTFGEQAKAARWLQHPNRALGGLIPFDILDTDAGVKSVLTILGRIDYGLYS
jgi:putative toxin-antitoxin system antitoxin component (TIGR02293 family)